METYWREGNNVYSFVMAQMLERIMYTIYAEGQKKQVEIKQQQ